MIKKEKVIPYCGRCSRKQRRHELKVDEYFCPVVADTPMKGVVYIDTDGTECVERGVYIAQLEKEACHA